MMTITIDNYRPGDEERMKDIAARAFSRFTREGLDFMLPRDKVEDAFREEVQSYTRRAQEQTEGLGVFVARRDGQVVGHIALVVNQGRSQQFGMKWGILASLVVDPDYHHQGIGTALIKRAMEWFREQRCEYVEVSTDQNNIAAIRAYEAAGFRVIYSGLTLSQKLSD